MLWMRAWRLCGAGHIRTPLDWSPECMTCSAGRQAEAEEGRQEAEEAEEAEEGTQEAEEGTQEAGTG